MALNDDLERLKVEAERLGYDLTRSKAKPRVFNRPYPWAAVEQALDALVPKTRMDVRFYPIDNTPFEDGPKGVLAIRTIGPKRMEDILDYLGELGPEPPYEEGS